MEQTSILLAAFLLCAPVAPAAAPAERGAVLADLSWMAGAWRTPQGEIRVEERWTDAAGDLMLGVGRTLAGGKTVFFEFLRIESRPDGIYYVAQPRGAPGTDFKLTRAAAGEVVFENPAHDFPKRITYRKHPDGSLTARVDGGPGSDQSEEFHYARVEGR